MPKLKKPKKPKPTTGPSVAAHLPSDPGELYTRCTASLTAFKADPAHYASTFPPLNEVEQDLVVLGSALQAAAGGDPVAKAALFVAANKVRADFHLLAKVVQTVVRAGPIEDAPALIANVLMYESKVGKKKPKAELEAKQGATSGLIRLIALAIASAVTYTWESSVDQLSWNVSGTTPQAHTSIAGLTPGKTYYFRYRALLRDGTTTNYSQVVSFMVK